MYQQWEACQVLMCTTDIIKEPAGCCHPDCGSYQNELPGTVNDCVCLHIVASGKVHSIA